MKLTIQKSDVLEDWFLIERAEHDVEESADNADPTWEEGVPHCSERCKHFDGKRCELLGVRPSFICEPVVSAMADRIDSEARRKAQ